MSKWKMDVEVCGKETYHGVESSNLQHGPWLRRKGEIPCRWRCSTDLCAVR